MQVEPQTTWCTVTNGQVEPTQESVKVCIAWSRHDLWHVVKMVSVKFRQCIKLNLWWNWRKLWLNLFEVYGEEYVSCTRDFVKVEKMINIVDISACQEPMRMLQKTNKTKQTKTTHMFENDWRLGIRMITEMLSSIKHKSLCEGWPKSVEPWSKRKSQHICADISEQP